MFSKVKMLFLLAVILSSSIAKAQLSEVYDGHTVMPSDLSQLTSQVRAGSIVVLGENHGQPSQQVQQMKVIQAVRQTQPKVSVGLEFMWYTDQPAIDAYRTNQITEEEFLKNWRGGYNFNLYKSQLIAPNIQNGEYSLGLNLPQPIASKIGKLGLNGLTEDDWKIMPPQFQLGRESYKKRFVDQMGGHGGPNIDNYFAAQSAWDETMAWRSVEFLKQHPDQVLVIVVGEFHVQYGGGLPDRIKARLAAEGMNNSILTVSQMMVYGMAPEQIAAEMIPSKVEGPRADFIMLDTAQPVQ